MKTNKKAILGMLVAITLSLGSIVGVNSKVTETNLQQVSVGCAYFAGETEGGLSNALQTTSNIAADVCAGGTVAGLGAVAFSTTNPVGWGYWLGVGVVGL